MYNIKHEKNENVVWRNEFGEVACPGGNCPQECDDTCPVFLRTKAAMCSSTGLLDDAVEFFRKAVEIAPDFYEAWNNMGATYGKMTKYDDAIKCYEKARELRPDKFNPVYGLALANRDAGYYDKCIEYCDLYDRLFSDGKVRNIRRKCLELMGNM